jgi:P2-related tail formation protein
MTAASLLPNNSSDLEFALAYALSRDPGSPLRALRDPYTVPAGSLPWLASHHGVRLWFDDWSEARKRDVVAHHAGLHPAYEGERLGDLVGTRAGLDRYLSYVDASVVHSLAYPAPFIVGDTAAGSRRVNQAPFTADYLVQVVLVENDETLAAGANAVGDVSVSPPDNRPIDRALAAARAAKATAILLGLFFETRRALTTAEATSTSSALSVGDFLDKLELSA